ncbi:tetratricopeptide repeat protein [Methylocella sp.]|uniref:O-linked N-acetylglucosamine transferase family protein n=1 Tax=Methylocella sp. TaxID=1978226 RepID=UPI00378384C1
MGGQGALAECGRGEAPDDALDAQGLALAQELLRAGRGEAAEALYRARLAAAPRDPLCLHHLGLIAHGRGAHEEAAELVAEAVAARPAYVEALSNLSAILRALKRPGEALATAERALLFDGDFAQGHSNRGAALEDLGRLDEALEAYRRAHALNPAFVEAAVNAAHVLRRLGRPFEALALCESVAAARPDAADPCFALGVILKELGRPGPAAEAFRRAVALRPSFAEAYVNLGDALQGRRAYEAAAEAYAEALRLRPDLAAAHANLGAAMERLGRLDEAVASYARALQIDPGLTRVRSWLHHKRRILCDWDGLAAEEAELLARADAGERLDAFSPLSLATSPAQQLEIARSAARDVPGRPLDFGPPPPRDIKGRLRVGYLSNDFGRHATAVLAARLFELHDRARFETFAYSHGPDDRSEMGLRLRAAFDHFIDVSDLSDEAAARRIHADGVDVLVDLKGHTAGARLSILAMRPAPVQASFLGYPGTTGADFIDYAIVDPVVAPRALDAAFSEKLVRLPHCYQPNDPTRRIAEPAPTRAQCGLPDEGFVFCCFNNSYKLTPAFFDVWMRLLSATPGAVLWLLDSNPRAVDNLRREAERRGVDPQRLVFAPKLAGAEHLARHRLADLFLDTLPYNAHTTASDALWAGLPVLTCIGETFAGRAAASLLHAVGLPELVAPSLDVYERMALRFAHEGAGELREFRSRLAAGRLTAPLFDAPGYARDFEAALCAMWDLHSAGETPRAIDVAGGEAPTKPTLVSRTPYVACPLCGGENIPLVLGADCTRHALYQPALPSVMNWRECGDCGHVFTDGWFDEAACEIVFSKTHPGQSVGHDMERKRPIAGRMVERVARHVGEGRWLDVGFGDGSLLFAAEEWGFTPVGLDLRADNVATLRSLGYEAHCASVETIEAHEPFDVVSMADVLEHMPFPRQGLEAARRLLRPGGALLLSMPNMEAMTWRLLHANKVNPYWGEIEHYHNFSRRRLYALLREHGFEPAEYAVSERYRVCMEVIARRL